MNLKQIMENIYKFNEWYNNQSEENGIIILLIVILLIVVLPNPLIALFLLAFITMRIIGVKPLPKKNNIVEFKKDIKSESFPETD